MSTLKQRGCINAPRSHKFQDPYILLQWLKVCLKILELWIPNITFLWKMYTRESTHKEKSD